MNNNLTQRLTKTLALLYEHIIYFWRDSVLYIKYKYIFVEWLEQLIANSLQYLRSHLERKIYFLIIIYIRLFVSQKIVSTQEFKQSQITAVILRVKIIIASSPSILRHTTVLQLQTLYTPLTYFIEILITVSAKN